MPVIPYERQVRVPGAIDGRRAGADSFGSAGLSIAGRAVSEFTEQALQTEERKLAYDERMLERIKRETEKLEREAEKTAMLEAEKIAAESNRHWMTWMDQMRQEGKTGAGFVERFMAQANDRRNDLLGKIENETARKHLETALLRGENSFLDNVYQTQVATVGAQRLADFQALQNENMNTVRANPSMLESALNQEYRVLSVLGGDLGAPKRDQMIRASQNALSDSAMQGMIAKATTVAEAERLISTLTEGPPGDFWKQVMSPQDYRRSLDQLKALREHNSVKLKNDVVAEFKDWEFVIKSTGEDSGQFSDKWIRENIPDETLREKMLSVAATARKIGSAVKEIRAIPADEVNKRIQQSTDTFNAKKDRDSLEVMKAVANAVQIRIDRYKKDPAGYAISVNPVLESLWQVVATNRGPRSIFQNYANSMRAAQESLAPGTELDLLPKAGIEVIRRQLSNIEDTPDGAEKIFRELGAMQENWGAQWPLIQGQLEREKVLTGVQSIAASMTGLGKQIVGQQLMRASAIGEKEMKKSLEIDKLDSKLDAEISGNLTDFMRTIIPQRGEKQYRDYQDAVRLYSLRILQSGEERSVGAAVKKAAAAIVNENYVFAGSYRIPRNNRNDPQMINLGTKAILDLVSKGEYPLVVRDLFGGANPDPYLSGSGPSMLARTGVWVTNKDETGLVLTYPDGNHTAVKYRDKDGAVKSIELKWDELERVGQTRFDTIREMAPENEGLFLYQ